MKSFIDLSDISQRNALITGGAGHIALAAEEVLVELGANVSILDVSMEACQSRINLISKIRKHRGIAISADLRDEEATRDSVKEVIHRMGGLDILIHCAAYNDPKAPGWSVPFRNQTVQAWDTAMRINLTSAFVMVQEAEIALASSGHGSVILFGSHYGLVGPDMNLYADTEMANEAGYAASKGGVIQLARYLATLLAPDIRVNSISPGGVWRNQPDAFYNRYVQRTPLKRMATEEDLKGAVAYLSSDLSNYVTGHNLVVDGGITAW